MSRRYEKPIERDRCLMGPLRAMAFVACLCMFSATVGAADDCLPGGSTITAETEYPESFQLLWDEERSAAEFPAEEPPVAVFVKGGQGPYRWQVNEGFDLDCTDDCSIGNTLYSGGTACIAYISVSDSLGRKAAGKVRRRGYWSGLCCFENPKTYCYNNPCNSPERHIRDLVDHRIDFFCCEQSRVMSITGVCDADGWQYQVNASDCNLPDTCDHSGLSFLQIRRWICY